MNGIGGYVTTPAAYGGYAASPSNEALILAQRNNPYRYLLTGEDMNQDVPDGYANGGVAGSMIGQAGNAAAILDLLLSIGGLGSTKRDGSAASSADGMSGATGGTGSSGANWGPTGQGLDGLSVGKSGGFGLGPIGNAVAGKALSMAIPGAGLVSSLGNSFNAGARSSQLADAIGQIGGKEPGTQGIGSFLGGAFGIGGTKDSDFGKVAMDHNLSPDQADMALSNYGMTGNVNATPAQIAAAQAAQAQAAAQMAMPGYGIAGIAGAAASGVSPDVNLNINDSARAFGVDPANVTSAAVGRDGVASVSFAADGGSGAGGGAGGTGGSGANGGGQSGNGSNGNGDGANWRGGRIGFAGGGVIRSFGGDFFTKKLARGSGLVTGLSGGRADKINVHVPHGSYVVPADVVSGLGQGNTAAGGKMLAGMMPKSPGLRFAGGGIAGEPQPVPIQVSAGEFVVHPAHLAALGGGNPQAGADAMDQMVRGVRQQNAQVAQGMPTPR